MRNKLAIIILLFLFTLPACDFIRSTNTPAETAVATQTATPATTPVLQSTPDIPTPITDTEQTDSALIIWIPPDSLLSNEEAAAVFSDQILAFSANHPELETRVEQKPVTGQGGILGYLRSGNEVAPSILPDLIALPTNQLPVAASEGLIFPLDALLEPSLLDDLYPAARTLSQVGEQTIGYPFILTNLTHLAYDDDSTALPMQWSELISTTERSFIFPAAGDPGALLALQLYLQADGNLTNEANQPILELEPLVTALGQLRDGRSTGLILPQSSNVASLTESWQVFRASSANVALTTANQFLAERSAEQPTGYGPVAGIDGPVVPLVDGWAWAISTAEPDQQALAAELLSGLVSQPVLGAWSLQTNQLPARRAAFDAWPTDDEYATFARAELERAEPNPMRANSAIMVALSDAVFNVVSLAKSPEGAATEAVTAVQP